MTTLATQLDTTPTAALFGLVLSVLLTGLAAGFFFAYSANVVLALGELSAATYTEVMQPINESVRNVAFGVVFFGAVVVPLATAVAVALRGDLRTSYGLVFLVGVVVYLAGTFAVTVTVHLPLNEFIAGWSPTAPPEDWAAVRARWARWNLVRTVAAAVAFSLYLLATLLFVATATAPR